MRPLFLTIALIVSGCIADVGKDKAAAEVVTDTPKASTPTEGKSLRVSTEKSKISALSAKVTKKHPIQFPEFSGAIQLEGDEVSSVSFEVAMAKLQADHPRLTEHLLNEDFFDVSKYPTSSFKSSSVTKEAGNGGTTHTITGDLSIRGNTKTIKFPATLGSSTSAVTADAEFTINRHDFGVSYKGKADDLIQDNVVLTIQLSASR